MERHRLPFPRWIAAALAGLAAVLIAVPVHADEHRGDRVEAIEALITPMQGDLDEIAERGMLRMAIPYNPIYFAYDGDKVIGLAVERAREFEAFLRKRLKKRIDVILVPLPRDKIIPAVLAGEADIAAANLTITPEREEVVAFSAPIHRGVSEKLVTGPNLGPVESFDDLVDTGIYLRPSSSYYQHMRRLNHQREEAGKKAIPILNADERLEDYDLLDLLNSGAIPAIVVDSHKLDLWVQVFDDIVVHDDLVLNEGGRIAWAMRPDNPQLLKITNAFIANIKVGTLIGNVLEERYLKSSEWIEGIREGRALSQYREITDIIKRTAGEFGFDWKMILAQAYQESKLDHTRESHRGAVGIMQVRPSTAADPNVGVEDISSPENNILAGVKYLNFLRERYFAEEGLSAVDEILFSLAAYNAGPRAIARARNHARRSGLNPDVWFSNVEIAAARTISREPVEYVRNIYKYFVAFSLADTDAKLAARETMLSDNGGPGGGRGGEMALALQVAGGVAVLAGAAVFLVWRRRQRS